MGKNVKIRIMAFFLAFLMACSGLTSMPVEVQAAKKPTKITVSASTKTLYVGDSFALKVKSVKPQNASKAVTYTSSNKSIATVNSKGKVTAKKKGKVTITVRSKLNKKVRAKCTVTVKQQVKKITVKNVVNNTAVIKKGKTLKLKCSVSPSNANNKKLTYTTNKKSVATVDKNGKIKAKGYGTAKITIRSADKKAKATITVKVPKKAVTKVKVTPTKKTITVGGTFRLNTVVSPSNASVKDVFYESSNKKIAVVDQKGKVKGVKKGTAIIKVTTLDGKKTASCKVTVQEKKAPVKEILVTEVVVTPTKATLTEGETTALAVLVKPDNASNRNVIWKSSNQEIAKVDSNGVVTAVREGSAEITATAADGSGKKAVCAVTVSRAPLEDPYKLVWEDNFDGTQLNMEDWNYEYHEPGWVNNELQKYVDAPENIYVKDGKLVIQALKGEDGSYTSGRINTQNKHDYKYGKFEVRAKVPSGKGFLPAFWMMPTNENLYGQWPKCGEIDIMEVLGSETNKTYGTLHFGEPHTQSQGSYVLPEGDFSSEYHVYACEWEPNEIRFYVDGQLFYSENDWFSKKEGYGELTYPAPYDQPFYLILNLAVGGNWPGNPDETTQFADNAQLCVDYVRVYQKESYDEDVEKPAEELEFKDPDETGNYVCNGNFAENEDLEKADGWQFLLAGEGAATAVISGKAIHIETENAGNLNHSVQLVQAGMPMEQGKRYRFSFDAWAQEARTMITDISAPDKGYKRYLADTTVELGTEKQNYSYEFDMTDSGDVNGRIEFNLGNQGSTAGVYITNVRLEQIGEAEIPEEVKNVLPDGNYVYNGEFQQGSNRMDYWSVESACEGVTVQVTNDNNVRELKVAMPQSVVSPGQVIVKQDEIAITGGKNYILSFDAYADGTGKIQAKIAGQTFTGDLTAERKNFKYTFTTGDDIKGSVLEFLLGQPRTVYLDNVRIQEDSLLLNGDFSNGLTGFELYAYNSNDVSYVVDELKEDKAACIDIQNTGEQDWYIQLKQSNIKLEKGKWYRISMDVKSTMERKIMYTLQRDGTVDDDWTPYSGNQVIQLTGEYQTFSHEFQMKGETDANTILSITMGAVEGTQISQKHTVVIDNIRLEEIEAPAKEEVPEGTNLIINGDFLQQDAGWVNVITEPGIAEADFTGNKAIYYITDPGNEDWNVQLKQEGLTLEQDAEYRVSFKIKSSAARTVKYALLDPSAGYAWYGGGDITLDADQEEQIDAVLTISEASSDTIDFVISMGKIGEETPASDIEISDISIVKQ